MKTIAFNVNPVIDSTGHYFVIEKVLSNKDRSLIRREDMITIYYYKESNFNGVPSPVMLMPKELALKMAEEIADNLSEEFGITD